MPERTWTADEILSELERDKKVSKDEAGDVSVDMNRIDDLIRDILTKDKERELQKSREQFTAQEKNEIEKEVRVQTNSLTRKLQEMKRDAGKARTQAIRVQLSGEVQTETSDRQEPTLGMAPEAFLALREQRRQRAEQFVLDPAKPPEEPAALPAGEEPTADNAPDSMAPAEPACAEPEKAESDTISAEELAAAAEELRPGTQPAKENSFLSETEDPSAQAFHFDERAASYVFSDDDEYVSSEQRDTVLSLLRKRLRHAQISRALTAVCAFFGIMLAAVQFGTSSVWLLGIIEVSPLLYSALCILLLSLSLAASFPVVSGAAHGVKKDLFAAAAAFIVMTANVFFLFSPEILLTGRGVLYAPLTALSLFALSCGGVVRARRTLESFGMLSGEEPLCGVIFSEENGSSHEMTRGLAIEEEPVMAANVPTGFFDGILTREQQGDPADEAAGPLMWTALAVGAVLAIAVYFMTKDLYAVVTMFSGAAAVGFGLILPVLCELPLHDSRAVFETYESTIPDWSTISETSDVNCVLLKAPDLFPEGSVVLHGIKTFQGTRIDTAIIDAASVVCKADSVLRDVFLYIINNRTELLKPVDTIRYEDLMGLSAWVDEKRVLIGNRELMVNHSIAVPKRGYEEPYEAEGCEVVYLAREGELYAAFIVEFTAAEKTAAVLDMMRRRRLCGAVRSVDACVTPALLERVLGVTADEIKILPARLHESFDEKHAPRDRAETSLANKGGRGAFVISVAACAQLLRSVKKGRVLCYAGAVVLSLVLAALLVLHFMTAASAAAMAGGCFLFFLLYWLYERNVKL